MSNQVNHRRPATKNNKRQKERPNFAMGCSDEGHNGQIGRRKWVALSRRNERRNAKQGRPASIGKFKKETFIMKPHHMMMEGVLVESFNERRKVRIPKPLIPDTGEDD